MFGLFKKKQKQKPSSPFMVWLFLAFLFYAIVANNARIPAPSTQTQQSETEQDKKEDQADDMSLGSIVDPKKILNAGLLADKIFPQKTIKLSAKDSLEGNGKVAVCGQQTTIRYRSLNEEKKEIDNVKSLTFRIGEEKVIPALERGVVGMKKNGKRTIFSPGYLAYGAENFTRSDVPALANIRFEVEMLELSPTLPELSSFRVLGDTRTSGEAYLCGSKAKLHLSIWDVEGNKLYDTKDNNDGNPLTFTIGTSEVFFGLEQGSLGMFTGMNRALIVPPGLQKNLHENPDSIHFPFPEKQTVLVYIQSVP